MADALAADQLKPAESILRDLPPMPADWISRLFAASYYQAAPGEALLQAIPTGLRKPDPVKRRALKAVSKAEHEAPMQPALTAGANGCT